MLSLLRISNLALVDRLTWDVGEGLVCVTGETGAGKSIIVGAIKLVLGERADRGLVRTGTASCSVEAVFDLPDAAVVNAQLEAVGLEPCEEHQLVVKRVVGAKSGGKQFVNGSPTTLAVLKDLAHFLVDLHGPHEHQSLISQERQLNMLDAFAGSGKAREAFREAFDQWRDLARELETLGKSERATEQEIDLLRYQIQEIAKADPKPDEWEPLESRYQLASNAARLLELVQKVVHQLADGDRSVVDQLGESQRWIRELESTDPQITELTTEFEGARVALEEIVVSLRDYAEELAFDPGEIAEIEERMNVLETLKRKYGDRIEEVIAFRERAEAKLALIEGRDDVLDQLRSQEEEARRERDVRAARLSKARRAAAPKLAKGIAAHLKDLGFKRSTIEIVLSPHETVGAQGAETVDFVFAPNPGEPSKPLRLTASSGEMARVMLAVKSALANQDAIPLLVFDEIDANVGGEIARAVGVKMAELAKSHQVISITHLPQVAALADGHCVVEKRFADSRTYSSLRLVEEEARVVELARMLGGDEHSARAHARSLLDSHQSRT